MKNVVNSLTCSYVSTSWGKQNQQEINNPKGSSWFLGETNTL